MEPMFLQSCIEFIDSNKSNKWKLSQSRDNNDDPTPVSKIEIINCWYALNNNTFSFYEYSFYLLPRKVMIDEVVA